MGKRWVGYKEVKKEEEPSLFRRFASGWKANLNQNTHFSAWENHTLLKTEIKNLMRLSNPRGKESV